MEPLLLEMPACGVLSVLQPGRLAFPPPAAHKQSINDDTLQILIIKGI
jgi:hypothetical protein